jgi:D-tagatose-1,6-bisphosphate aldolase subunit GatZ/KbaZ
MKAAQVINRIIASKLSGKPYGVFSICSANDHVIQSAMRYARESSIPLVIESTCNQVNQYGGYTKMLPQEFAEYIASSAKKANLDIKEIMLGGDHLGPSVWASERVETAMEKAEELVRQYVRAGYKKIHLDASNPCSDDPLPLSSKIVADREACLAKAAMEEAEDCSMDINDFFFVLGTEVPYPGGSIEIEEGVRISDVFETEEHIVETFESFKRSDLQKIWDRTIAFVVQPGVEFNDEKIFRYDHSKSEQLTALIKKYDHLVYEAHSTDFQTQQALFKMVEGHFSILKVGPALTFAFREALLSLELIEKKLVRQPCHELSSLFDTLTRKMVEVPKYWINYYSENEDVRNYQFIYSLYDRIRYYWTDPEVVKAVNTLKNNLCRGAIPYALISQYFPDQKEKIMSGYLMPEPDDLIYGRISDVLNEYKMACFRN